MVVLHSTVTYNTNCSTCYHKECPQSILHSPTLSLIQITSKARNSEYLLNANNTEQKDINLTQVPMLLLDLQIGSWFSFSAIPLICDFLSIKMSHHISTMRWSFTWFTTKKFPFKELQWKLPCSEKASTNSCHNQTIQTSLLILLIWAFYYLQISVWQHSQYID